LHVELIPFAAETN